MEKKQMALEYADFITYVRENIEDYIEGSKITEVKIIPVVKNNQIVMDALQIKSAGLRRIPVIYLDSFYEEYLLGLSLSVILERIANAFLDGLRINGVIDPDEIRYFEKIKNLITMRLVNAAKNQIILEDCPSRALEDLAITYRILAGQNDGGISTILITNELLKKWNVSEALLYDLACENSRRLFPPVIEDVRSILESSMDISDVDELFSPKYPHKELYVLTNDCKINGASVICYSDILEDFADQLQCDLFVLPSSIHEVILVPATGDIPPHRLRDIVAIANQNVVQKEEVLSDSVYYYSRTYGKIEKYAGQMKRNLLQ